MKTGKLGVDKVNNNKGYTLFEILIAVAVLVILTTLLTPLITAYTKSHKKMTEINDLDLELSKTVEVVKRSIRFAQDDESNSYEAIVYPDAWPADDAENAPTSSSLTVIVREEDVYNYVTFWFDSDNNEFNVGSTTTAGTTASGITGGSTLMTDVDAVEFKYSENIVTIYFRLTKDGITREVRDAGVTRIDYDL